MPYKTKAELARENWMTLPEAAAHIRSVEKFKQKRDAYKELLKALEDNAFVHPRGLTLIRWGDEVRISGKAPNEIWPRGDPPRGWRRAKIRWATGKVLDPYGAVEDGNWHPAWRTVLLARSTVMQLWPKSVQPETPKSSSRNVAPFKRSTGPQTKKLSSMIESMKSDIRAKHLTVDRLRNMSDKELVSKYGLKVEGRRTSCREARKRVVTEFDGNSNSVK
jgi:hypothetical protein